MEYFNIYIFKAGKKMALKNNGRNLYCNLKEKTCLL